MFGAASLAASHANAAPTFTDPNFSVCAFGSPDVTSCGATDPQRINSSGATVGIIGGAGTAINPFLLFAVVPDLPTPTFPGSPAPAPVPGTSSDLTISLATSAQYGQTNVPVNGYLGEMTSSSSDLYAFAGLPGNATNSMNFSNLSGSVESGLFGGTAPTSFSVYEYTVTVNGTTVGHNLPTGGPYDLPFNSLLVGTYLAAWGIDTFPLPDHGNVQVFGSPFTTSGLVTSTSSSSSSSSTSSSSTSSTSSTGGGGGSSGGTVPEPGTLALLGLGLAVVSLARNRYMRRG